MVERKLYKTKLCVLYQKGRCHRHSCSFAHGNAELRRSFNGRRDHGGGDLREKLDRRRSPIRRYSPTRDARGRRASHGESPRSHGRRSDSKHRKKQQLDGQSDFSGSPKSGDTNEDQDIKKVSLDSRDSLDEQKRHVQSEINMLLDHRKQLELYVEEKVQEVNILASKNQELEMQLNKEQEESMRMAAKLKKFLEAYNRHSRLQDELKRSYNQLQKLGEKLSSDILRSGTNAQDSSVNITSDEEIFGDNITRPRNELHKNATSSKKRLRNHHETRAFNPEATRGEETTMKKIRSEEFSQLNACHTKFDGSSRTEVDGNGENELRALPRESKARKEKDSGIPSADKSKPEMPSTSIAAHALDEEVEIVEMDEKFDAMGTAAAMAPKDVAANKSSRLPFLPPPPPPIPNNAYSRYRGNDDGVDIVGVDEEMRDVDIV